MNFLSPVSFPFLFPLFPFPFPFPLSPFQLIPVRDIVLDALQTMPADLLGEFRHAKPSEKHHLSHDSNTAFPTRTISLGLPLYWWNVSNTAAARLRIGDTPTTNALTELLGSPSCFWSTSPDTLILGLPRFPAKTPRKRRIKSDARSGKAGPETDLSSPKQAPTAMIKL